MKATFKDIDLSFTKHPVTGDIPVRKDSNAVKASIQNLVMTRFHERGFNARVGSNVYGLLFENVDPLLTHELKREIEIVIENFEPRAELDEVVVGLYENKLTATVSFYILNNSSPEVLNLELERLR